MPAPSSARSQPALWSAKVRRLREEFCDGLAFVGDGDGSLAVHEAFRGVDAEGGEDGGKEIRHADGLGGDAHGELVRLADDLAGAQAATG